MKTFTRRKFLEHGTLAVGTGVVANAVLPGWVGADPIRTTVERDMSVAMARDFAALPVDPDIVRTLALRAIDAARSAGAAYADVRLTRIVTQGLYAGGEVVSDGEQLDVGVRALVGGYWGFAASPYWTVEDVTQLARDAVSQARENGRGGSRTVELGHYPTASGTWVAPVRYDPFLIPIEEKLDLFASWRSALEQYPGIKSAISTVNFMRQERAVATTEGAYFTQMTYQTGGILGVSVPDVHHRGVRGYVYPSVTAAGFNRSGAGWEQFVDANVIDQAPALVAEAEAWYATPVRPIDVGRYEVVCDARTMASLVGESFGVATQLDRALGYEANASGTSYLGPDPLELLGTARVAASQVTIRGNRTQPAGLATVKWDDEGVEPDDVPLVTNGILTDYQTTREQAAWLAPYYQKAGRPVRSHGCAAAPNAGDITLQHMPNLSLEPASASTTFADLVAGVPRGMAIFSGRAGMDFQARNGGIDGIVREITNGKLGAILVGGNALFSTQEFWTNVTALGGRASAEPFPQFTQKGQPDQGHGYTVSAVPAKIKNLAIIDRNRKA